MPPALRRAAKGKKRKTETIHHHPNSGGAFQKREERPLVLCGDPIRPRFKKKKRRKRALLAELACARSWALGERPGYRGKKKKKEKAAGSKGRKGKIGPSEASNPDRPGGPNPDCGARGGRGERKARPGPGRLRLPGEKKKREGGRKPPPGLPERTQVSPGQFTDGGNFEKKKEGKRGGTRRVKPVLIRFFHHRRP